jgi:hypothetical protein
MADFVIGTLGMKAFTITCFTKKIEGAVRGRYSRRGGF